MSSFFLRFLEGKMRSYHRSNQHKHFNKSDIMNLLCHYSPRLKKYIYDTNNNENSKYNSCAASIFNETHVFRREFSFFIYTEKRKEEKTEFEQSSWWHKIRLSLKRGFDGCEHGFGRCDGLGRLGRFNGLSRFGGFDGLDGFGGCDGFSGFGRFVF